MGWLLPWQAGQGEEKKLIRWPPFAKRNGSRQMPRNLWGIRSLTSPKITGCPQTLAAFKTSIRPSIIFLVMFLLATVAMSCGTSAAGSSGGPAGQPVLAALAPDVVLPTFADDFRLSDHRGDVAVLYFSFPG